MAALVTLLLLLGVANAYAQDAQSVERPLLASQPDRGLVVDSVEMQRRAQGVLKQQLESQKTIDARKPPAMRQEK